MRNWKKLLLCIVLSVLVSVFIGSTLAFINDRLFIHSEALTDVLEGNVNEYVEEVNKIYNSEKSSSEITQDLNSFIKFIIFYSSSSIYQATAGQSGMLYIISLLIGILTGILIYIMFIMQLKTKKVLLISTICIAILLLFLNIKYIISDIQQGLFGLSSLAPQSNIFIIIFKIYFIILLILYVINLVYQKRIAKKLNNELKK